MPRTPKPDSQQDTLGPGNAPASQPRPASRSRIVGEADVPPGELTANPANWRTHPDHQVAAAAPLTRGWT